VTPSLGSKCGGT